MIRRLLPADAPAYVEIRREMLLDSPWAFLASPESDRGCDPAGVAASLPGEGYAILGAFDAETLQSVACFIRDRAEKRQHIAWVVGVYTRPQARGRGLARGVMGATIDLARQWPGVDWIQLGVSQHAPAARALYESLGFLAWGTEPDALRHNGLSYDETHMRLDLRPIRGVQSGQ